MPFDPNLPQEGTDLDAVEMRAQLTGLKDLIDAILTITAAQIDSVSTGNSGEPATVGLSVVGNTLHFTFSLPRGDAGGTGPQGNNGMDGAPGGVGPQGPPFAAAVVDGVTTLDPGNAATVGVIFDGSNVRFTFGIPRGADGSNGSNGADGDQGPPGEVTNAALASAIGGTSNNSNAVATLGQSADPNYQQSQIQDLINKVDELINALRR